MIEAKDLRIGNLFIEQSSKKIISVIGLEKNRVVFSGMFLEKWQAEPIPLTEEWLLRFGFKKNEYEGFFLNGIVFYDGLLTANQKDKIKYVHQLQNLYFALTNKELEATY